MAKTERSHRMVAVLFLDLDHFKAIDDSFGHEKGDLLLVEVAQRLLQSLRPGDTAARFGGDEFVVLLEDVATSQDAIRVAERIAFSLKTPFVLGTQGIEVTASIGIVLSEGSNTVQEELLRRADVAMYRAKNRGRAQYEVYSEEFNAKDVERLALEIELAGAIKRGELVLHYQPLVDLETGEVGAFEALLRWEHPDRGHLAPASFIPIAEETGLFATIGAWVLEEACRQVGEWTAASGRPVQVHVNLSVRQFEQINLLEEVGRVLERTGIAATQLVLEITESAVMADPRAATEQLRQLKELGVRVSIDDFGTGYSSLTYLEFFPIDSLKIDRSFVARLTEGTAVVKAIAMLGQAMNVEVAAEGVETVEQLRQLRDLHCRWGQGYLFSRPVRAKEAWGLLGKKFSF
jgi:diguanylate cyclase (GGDEF)-like protein